MDGVAVDMSRLKTDQGHRGLKFDSGKKPDDGSDPCWGRTFDMSKNRGRVMNEKVCVVKHVEDEGPGLIGDYFARLGWDLAVIEVFRGDPLPESFDSVAGVVVLGGPMNVYEEEAYPFLRLEEQFIKKVLAEEVPFLGVCLGGQLLAKACGATVTRSPHEEKGWFEVQMTAAVFIAPLLNRKCPAGKPCSKAVAGNRFIRGANAMSSESIENRLKKDTMPGIDGFGIANRK